MCLLQDLLGLCSTGVLSSPGRQPGSNTEDWPTYTQGPLTYGAEGPAWPHAVSHVGNMEFVNSVTDLQTKLVLTVKPTFPTRASKQGQACTSHLLPSVPHARAWLFLPSPFQECTIQKKGLEGTSFVFFQQAPPSSGRTRCLQWTICVRLVSQLKTIPKDENLILLLRHRVIMGLNEATQGRVDRCENEQSI